MNDKILVIDDSPHWEILDRLEVPKYEYILLQQHGIYCFVILSGIY